MQILVDYLSFTVSRLDFFSAGLDEQYIFERIRKLFLVDGLNYQQKRGMYGYLTGWTADGITICYGGREDIYLQLSGMGCRSLESLNRGMTWEGYLRYLQADFSSLHITRLDIACDTYGELSLSIIQKATRAGRYTSRFRTYLIQEGNKERSVIWGSAKSAVRLRIYDKTLERHNVGCEDVPPDWVRCEFQLRDDAAGAFISSWQEVGDLSQVYFRLLAQSVTLY